jgi:hypothetical protein
LGGFLRGGADEGGQQREGQEQGTKGCGHGVLDDREVDFGRWGQQEAGPTA